VKNKKVLLWLVPIFITIHNLEEAVFMPAFLEKRNYSIPSPMSVLLPPITYEQFLVALFIVTAIPYVIAWRAVQQRAVAVHMLLCLQIIMLINVIAHVATALFIGGYAPGVVTALAINLPFSICFLRLAVSEMWVSKKAMALLALVGLVLHAVALPGILILSGEIVRRF
jgi:uncharacterized protein with HXXEE motif